MANIQLWYCFCAYSLPCTQEPTSGLDTFIGYQILLSPAPPSTVTTPIFVGKTPISGTHIISGLEAGTTYTVTVATYNEDGLGPLTATTTATTPESGDTNTLFWGSI